MSSSAANPQHEPTMEEILASIRKIISEDQPEGAKPAPAPQPTPLRAVVPEPARAPLAAVAPSADLDVLDLTEEVPEEAPPAPAASPPIHDDIAFEDDESDSEPAPEPLAAEPEPNAEDDELISKSTRSLVSRAFATMDKGPVKYAPPPAGALDSIFVQAVQSAFQPTLKDWVNGHNAEILESLKPLIRAWMDEHLPPLIEAAVAKEIGRAASTRKR